MASALPAEIGTKGFVGPPPNSSCADLKASEKTKENLFRGP